MRERTGPMAAEQGRSIPAQLSRAPGQIFIPGQEIVAVAQKLAPSVRWDVGEWAMVVEARDPVDPTGRNATCSHIGRYFFRIMSFRIGESIPVWLMVEPRGARRAKQAVSPTAR